MVNDHFQTADNAIKSGKESLNMLEHALQLLNFARDESKYFLGSFYDEAAVVNPVEAGRRKLNNYYDSRLGEDRRFLLYGIDTMQIMTELLEYHNALYQEDNITADKVWSKIVRTADRLDSYYIPIGYEWPGPGLETKDALTRTQVRGIIERCRYNRL